MFYALDENGVRIPIERAVKKNRYHCPCCDHTMIVKQGKVNVWHFAHEPGSDCDASYTEMTAWHKDWQNLFPEECREVVVQDMTGYKRIADVKIDGITLEFQSKSIPKDVFDARNAHHIMASHKVVWIFNCLNKEIETWCLSTDLTGELDGNKWYRWSHPNRMLAKYAYRSWAMIDKDNGNVFKNIDIYFQTSYQRMIQLLYVPDDNENVGRFLGKPVCVNEFVKSVNKPKQLTLFA